MVLIREDTIYARFLHEAVLRKVLARRALPLVKHRRRRASLKLPIAAIVQRLGVEFIQAQSE